jgi:Flp pilus assembly protein TadD
MLRIIVLSATLWAIVVFSVGCAQQTQTSGPGGGENSKWVQMNAEEMARAPKAKSPDINASTFFATGILLENQGNLTEAIDKFNKAIELDPKYHAAYNHLGAIHLKLQQFDQAEAVYQKALKHSPNDPVQLNNLAFVHLTQHRYGESEKELRRALKAAPDFSRAQVNLGIALAKQEKYPESLDYFRKACSEAQANYNLAIILHAENKVELARKYYQTALNFDGDFKAAEEGLEKLNSSRPATFPAEKSDP